MIRRVAISSFRNRLAAPLIAGGSTFPLLHAAPSSSPLWTPKATFLTSTRSLLQLETTDKLLARARGGNSSATGASSNDVNYFSQPQQYQEPQSSGNTADSLTPHVRKHLARVYTLLGAGCLACGAGSALMFLTPLGKTIPYWLPMVAGFVPLLWLSFAPPRNPTLKLALFFTFTVLEGMAIAPIVKMTLVKGVLGSAVVLTAAVFGGFSAAAYLAPRASMLALQGPLYGMLIGMVAISLLNMFYPTAFAHSLILYGGLALFSVMISVDTQAMIERARCGAGDHVQDAVQMFMNVINIFVRIAQILGGRD